MQLDEPAHHPQAHAETSERTIERTFRLGEQVEDARQQVRADSYPFVCHGYRDLIADDRGRQRNFSIRVHVLRRIGKQVGKNLLEPGGVSIDEHTPIRQRN